MTELDLSKDDYNIDFEKIKELISEYEKLKKSGEISHKRETETRDSFIDPLFKALGWNMENRLNRTDSVSKEEPISTKRSDYGFRINGIPKFFLEAKSLREENIDKNHNYITQAIDYAWMKTCSWAILCNFETIAIYNADWRDSNYGNNIVFIFHPSDFLTNPYFKMLSKRSFEKDEFDSYAKRHSKKQIKQRIDKQLLEDMIHFREVLSKDIVRNNQDKHLTQDELDESVQRILDRLIFIRNAEDKGLEENQLQSVVRQWNKKGKNHLIKQISKVYKDYDDKYNSKLFANHLCDDLFIDNEALQEVVNGLNHAKDNSYKYDFSIIESDVLGNIYEQYLGNILKSTPKRAKLEESKTHRKEQGIYYTPSYIVDYIVKNTVGEYIKTHTPEEIRKVRILDPACGSGSFLIRAYKELENYWKQNSNFAQLTLDSEEFYSKRVEILKNNIFGVDLDPKAVEIAQLNLLLQISETKKRLPILQNNIKIGNSLIDDPSISDRAFKWETEFPEIMNEGGFDIVIGNPPYINIKFLTKNDSGEKKYYQKKFTSALGNYDLYVLFIEKGISLLRADGLISLIIPNKFMVTDYGIGIRKYVLNTVMVKKIVDVSLISVFKNIGIYPIIFVFKRENNENLRMVSEVKTYRIENENDPINNNNFFKIEQKKYTENKNMIFLFGNYSTKNKIIQKVLKNTKFLSEICEVNSGTTGFEYTNWGKYIIELKTKEAIPFIITGNIEKYVLNRNKPVRYQGKKLINAYFTKGDDVTEGKWALFSTRKIVIRGMARNLTASYDDLGCACGVSVYTITNINQSVDVFYLLGVLNSKLIDFYYKSQFISKHLAGGYIGYNKGQIQQIPIFMANKSLQEKISRLVQDYISKSKVLLSLNGKKNDDGAHLEEILNNYQKSIDNLIYQAYGIGKSEIETIENIE